ncbi:MAG: fumarylacetoacetate hydrolase family protein [Rhodospirillales bacterium]|nr:fumarylacetoacetate hydrolase family protein [Rhodospirillales bacterium]
MATDRRLTEAARFLWTDHTARRPLRPCPDSCRPRSLAEAYAAQAHYRALSAPPNASFAGYKIALTSPVMQDLLAVHHPLAGAIHAGNIYPSPAILRADAFVHLGLECEIAVRLGAALPPAGAPYTRDSVAPAVAACLPAFELIDDRHARYPNVDLFSLIVENCWNAGVVLGTATGTDWRRLDLAALRGRLDIDGALAGEGGGADALGHPLEALAWLANHLAGRNLVLEQGMIVMTGSIVATKFVAPGARFRFVVDGLGEAICTIE